MRKFKLIKLYPGSPELNTIIIHKDNGWIDPYPSVEHDQMILIDWVIKYPEYWEEIIEKDYEILSYIDKANNSVIYKLDSQLKDLYCVIDGKAPFFTSVQLQYCYIHSVKRLSDSE